MIEEDSGCGVIPVSSIAGISSLSGSKYAAEYSVEYENTPRKATVYLYTRPLKGWSQSTTDKFRHWGLVFKYICNAVRYVEGNEHDELLKAFFYKESPMKGGQYYKLGEIESSPNDLRYLAITNELNNTRYDVGLNNCQHWAKQYVQQLGDQTVIDNLNNNHTLSEAKPILAEAVSKSDDSVKLSEHICNIL